MIVSLNGPVGTGAGLLSALQGDVIPVLEGCGFWKDENVFFVATSLVDGDHPGSSSRAGLPAAEEVRRLRLLCTPIAVLLVQCKPAIRRMH
jgi:hypothetical protein